MEMGIMSDLRIMVLDPGGVTGIMTAVVPRHMPSRLFEFLGSSMKLEHAPTPDEDWAGWNLWMKIVEYEPDVLVMEDFRLFPGVKHGPDTSGTIPDRLLAKIDFMLYLNRSENSPLEDWFRLMDPEVVKQMPGERLAVTDDELKEAGLWRTPSQLDKGIKIKGDHAMQALKHGIVWARKFYKSGGI